MKIVCPHCQVKGTAADGLLDKKVRCPECSTVFRVTENVTVDFVPLAEVAAAAVDVTVSEPATETAADEIVEPEIEVAVAEDVLQELDEVEGLPEELPEGVGACSKCGFVFSHQYIETHDSASFCTLCALRPMDEIS